MTELHIRKRTPCQDCGRRLLNIKNGLCFECTAKRNGGLTHDRTYEQGVIDGMTRYAWWKDGVQYVGTAGMTLAEAIEQFKGEVH